MRRDEMRREKTPAAARRNTHTNKTRTQQIIDARIVFHLSLSLSLSLSL